jgi:hypothetical protein
MGQEGSMERIVETDSKGRLTLGKQFANARFIVEEEDGDVTLRRAIVVSEREMWLYHNPTAWSKVEQGLSEAREGKLKRNAIDLDTLDD